MKLTDLEIGYLAGLFDGEGCVGYYKRSAHGTPYHSASLHICLTDQIVTDWIMDRVGYGKVSRCLKPDGRRTAYSWQLCNRHQIREVLEVIRPLLLVKATQVDVLLSLWQMEEKLPQGPNHVDANLIALRQNTANTIKQLKTESVETRRAGSSIH
jgi:hypothetical protein